MTHGIQVLWSDVFQIALLIAILVRVELIRRGK